MARRAAALAVALAMGVGLGAAGAAVQSTVDDGGPPAGAPGVVANPGGGVVLAAAGLEREQTCEALVDRLARLAAATHGGALARGVAVAEDRVAETAATGGDAGEAAAPATPVDGAPVGEGGTNVQVAGVDEPDVVERVDDLVVTGTSGVLRTVEVVEGEPVVRGELRLGMHGADLELLAAGPSRVVVLHTREKDPVVRPLAGTDVALHPGGWTATVVTLVDVADPVAPRAVAELELDGHLTAARGVDGVLRLALRQDPPWVQLRNDAGRVVEGPKMRERTLTTALRGTSAADWLPSVTDEDGTRPLVDCDRVGIPHAFSGLGTLTLAVVDATGDDLVLTDAEAVVAAGETLYATADRLVVATTSWWGAPVPLDGVLPVEPAGGIGDAPVAVEEPAPDRVDPPAPTPDGRDPRIDPLVDELRADDRSFVPDVMPAPPEPPEPTTALHVFDVDGTLVDHVASGEVEGRLVNQFAMSLHDGVLRTAVTTGGWTGRSQSSVVTHRVVGTELVEVGRLDGLGPDEEIQSVRYLGTTAYVVTFRRTDPLYVVDLADPTAPRALGELEVEGYSSYLHPLGDGRLLGIGQDADPATGRERGVQVSTFDVTDPTAPRRLDVDVVPDSWSEAQHDHHAVTVTADGLVAVPVERWAPGAASSRLGVLVEQVAADGTLSRRGVLATGTRWELLPRRTVVLDDVLLTVAPGRLATWDLAALTQLASADLTDW